MVLIILIPWLRMDYYLKIKIQLNSQFLNIIQNIKIRLMNLLRIWNYIVLQNINQYKIKWIKKKSNYQLVIPNIHQINKEVDHKLVFLVRLLN